MLAANATTTAAGTSIVIDAHEFPWSAIGRINIAGRGRCTATLIGPRHALTAAHCLFNANRKRFYQPFEVRFLPAYQRQIYRLNSRGKKFITPDNYKFSLRPQRPDDAAFDWAIIELEKPLGHITGYLGMRIMSDVQLQEEKRRRAQFVTVGYHVKFGQVQTLQFGCDVVGFPEPKNLNDPNVLQYQADMLVHENCRGSLGESGGPILLLNETGIRVIGVQSASWMIPGISFDTAASLSALVNVAVAGRSALSLRKLKLLQNVSAAPKSDSWISPKPEKTLASLIKQRRDGSTQVSDHLLKLISHAASVAKPQ